MDKNNILYDGRDKEGLAFSKGILVFVDTLFAISLVSGLCIAFSMLDLLAQGISISNGVPIATIIGGIVAGCGAASAISHVWYYKKTQVSHTAKTQAEIYMVVADKEVECKKTLMKIQHALKLSDMEASKANIQRVDSMTSGTFNALDSNIKTAMSDATSQIKKEA